MAAIELFRFRTVRPVENKQSGFSALSISPSKAPIIKPAKNPAKGPVGDLATSMNYLQPKLTTFLGLQQASLQQLSTLPIDPQTLSSALGDFAWLQQVSDELAAVSDYMSPPALIGILPTAPPPQSLWTTQVASAGWATLKQNLWDLLAYLAGLVAQSPATEPTYQIKVVPVPLTQTIELIARLILMQECISTLANDQTVVPPAQPQLQSADDVKLALSFRSVALPSLFFNNNPPVLARAPGVTDLSVVKDEWNRYIPGELANVVNVLPGETLETTSRHMEETVQAQSTTTQQSTTQTTENSQTTTQTLSSTATNDASTNIGVHGQVETSGQYGPTNVKTNIGAQAQFSKSSSDSTSLTKSVETVSRAVKTVSETITQMQSSRTTIRDTSFQKHQLQNSTANVVVGQYRWLSEVHRVQLVNYPNRFVVEFEIPEPGAWLRYALTNQPTTPWDNPYPGVFAVNGNDARLDPADPTTPDTNAKPLQPTDITPTVAAGLAARWRVQGLTPPPSDKITIGNAYSITPQANTPAVLYDNSMAVPDGYVAQTWCLDVTAVGSDDTSGRGQGQPAHASIVRVAVGGYGAAFSVGSSGTALLFYGNQQKVTVAQKSVTTPPVGNNPVSTNLDAPAPGDQPPAGCLPVGDINTGTIPVSLNAVYLAANSGITLNVNIQCSQIPAVGDLNGPKDQNGNPTPNGQPYVAWQLATFNTILAAYNNLLTAYNQERDARLQDQSGPLVVGPPALNLSRAVAELKRLAIQNLLGQPFSGYDLLTIGPTNAAAQVPNLGSGEPGLYPQSTRTSSPVIQFFEQAFEWENIVYICYPYFWGGRGTNTPNRWVVNATSASADPIFDQFLNAGSARLVVPARPGFEAMVNFFLYTSMVWSGQNPPGPNDPGYLSVADEIQSIQVGATDGTPIYPPWEVVLPTTLLWAGKDPTLPADSSGLPTNPNATIPAPPTLPASVALKATSSANPSVLGQPITFKVSVSAATGAGGAVPTGQVNFLVDGKPTADSPVALDANGNTTCAPIPTLAFGAHTVSVQYLGDGTFGAAIFNLPSQSVIGSVSVIVTSSANPSSHTKAVTFTAKVSAVAPAPGVPTGQVNFLIDGIATQDSPVTLDATGTAASTAAKNTLATGAHKVAVNYLGDANFAPGSGSLPTQAIN